MTKNYYIDKQKFYEEISAYLEHRKYCISKDKDIPTPNNYIGKCFQLIAENLSNSYNFRSYPFKEDMIGDAIINCIQYIHNFNPQKYNDPFAYFTQISYWAFVRRIEKEKKHLYTKYKAIGYQTLMDQLADQHDFYTDKSVYIDIGMSEGAKENMEVFIEEYEKKMEKKKQKKNDQQDTDSGDN